MKRLLQVVFILESCKVNALVFEAALEPFQKDVVVMVAALAILTAVFFRHPI